MNCLWCMNDLNQQLGWTSFLLLRKRNMLCAECFSKLEPLSGSRCHRCSRESDVEICMDCRWWMQQPVGESLAFNESVFSYNPFIQEIVAKWKYRGDYVLGEIFRPYLQTAFTKRFNEQKSLIAVPIPLSEERLHERGFNQAEMLANFLPVQIDQPLIRRHGEKQSKKSRKDRITAKNPFMLKKSVKKPVLLVDDIYTTGTTLRHAASLLVENGCPIVYSLTLIRG